MPNIDEGKVIKKLIRRKMKKMITIKYNDIALGTFQLVQLTVA